LSVGATRRDRRHLGGRHRDTGRPTAGGTGWYRGDGAGRHRLTIHPDESPRPTRHAGRGVADGVRAAAGEARKALPEPRPGQGAPTPTAPVVPLSDHPRKEWEPQNEEVAPAAPTGQLGYQHRRQPPSGGSDRHPAAGFRTIRHGIAISSRTVRAARLRWACNRGRGLHHDNSMDGVGGVGGGGSRRKFTRPVDGGEHASIVGSTIDLAWHLRWTASR
jgi:hypothetical protein